MAQLRLMKMMRLLFMNAKNNLTFEAVNPAYPLLGSVISSSIGSPTPEKIAQVLQSYQRPNQFLIGAFSSRNLIAVIGFELNSMHATIKHISVVDEFKKQGIGKSLIHSLIKDYTPSTVSLETDKESVDFYKKLGFICKPFASKYGTRYRCSASK
jgi:ribosomal protein S18 acetylase RimI-like enzyme